MPHNEWQIKIRDDGKMVIGVEEQWFLVIPEERSLLYLGKLENVQWTALATLNADLRYEMKKCGLICESVEHFCMDPDDAKDERALHVYMDFYELPLLLDVFNYCRAFHPGFVPVDINNKTL